jgi:hypothetical protein
MLTTASLAISRQILHSYIESSFFSSSFFGGFVEVGFGGGVKEYCVGERYSVLDSDEGSSGRVDVEAIF